MRCALLGNQPLARLACGSGDKKVSQKGWEGTEAGGQIQTFASQCSPIPCPWDFCRGLGSEQIMQAVKVYVPHDKHRNLWTF